jgi:hypothetical protein
MRRLRQGSPRQLPHTSRTGFRHFYARKVCRRYVVLRFRASAGPPDRGRCVAPTPRGGPCWHPSDGQGIGWRMTDGHAARHPDFHLPDAGIIRTGSEYPGVRRPDFHAACSSPPLPRAPRPSRHSRSGRTSGRQEYSGGITGPVRDSDVRIISPVTRIPACSGPTSGIIGPPALIFTTQGAGPAPWPGNSAPGGRRQAAPLRISGA